MLCFVFCTAHIAANYKFDALFCILRCTHCSTLLKADSEQKAMHTTYCSTQNLHFSSTNTTIRMLSAPSKMICNAQWSIARWYIVHFALQWSLGLPWGDGAAKGTEFRFQRQHPPPPISLPSPFPPNQVPLQLMREPLRCWYIMRSVLCTTHSALALIWHHCKPSMKAHKGTLWWNQSCQNWPKWPKWPRLFLKNHDSLKIPRLLKHLVGGCPFPS